MKKEVEKFVDAIKDNPEEIIKWARKEIKAYEYLIKLIRKNRP